MKQSTIVGIDGKPVRRIAPETPADVEVMREMERRDVARLGEHGLADQAVDLPIDEIEDGTNEDES